MIDLKKVSLSIRSPRSVGNSKTVHLVWRVLLLIKELQQEDFKEGPTIWIALYAEITTETAE